MPEIGTSGSMSGDRKRSDAARPKLPRLSSTLPSFHASYRSGWSGSWGRAAAWPAQGVDLPQWKGDRPSPTAVCTAARDPGCV